MSLANIKKVAFHDSLQTLMLRKLSNILSLSPNALIDPHFGCRALRELPNNEDTFLHLFPSVVGSQRVRPLHHPISSGPKQSFSPLHFELCYISPLSSKKRIWHMECFINTDSLNSKLPYKLEQSAPLGPSDRSTNLIDSSLSPSSAQNNDHQNNGFGIVLEPRNCNKSPFLPKSFPLQPNKKLKVSPVTNNIGGKCHYHTSGATNQKWPYVGTSSGSDSHMENQVSDSTAGGQWTENNMDSDVLTLKEKAGILGKYVQHVRHWDYTKLGAQHLKQPIPGFEFTLMTYNILSQDLLWTNNYLYRHCNPAVLQWSYRCENLFRELQDTYADVVCLQEVNEVHFNEYFKPNMEKIGYNGLYKKRTGIKQDGCAIFYKRNIFNLVAHEEIEFLKPGWSTLSQDNIALIAMLLPVNAPNQSVPLCIATTHLLFNPRRGDIKLAQLQLLLAEIDKFAFKGISKRTGLPHYHPVVLCGDMNSEPFSPLYNFVCQGHLNYGGLRSGDISGQQEGASRGRVIYSEPLVNPEMGITNTCQYANLGHIKLKENSSLKDSQPEKPLSDPSSSAIDFLANEACWNPIASPDSSSCGSISHHLNFLSAYQHTDQDGSHFVTTQHTKANCTVDYIFYSARRKDQIAGISLQPAVSEGRLRLLGTYRTMTNKEVINVGGLPNAFQPSDHLYLLAKFLLKQT